jgi:hypothetical protein
MVITNNTGQKIHYRVDRPPGGGDCGDLAPEGEAVLPSFDNKTDVRVVLHIPQTGDETEVIVAQPGL